jgi:hypothetical protein
MEINGPANYYVFQIALDTKVCGFVSQILFSKINDLAWVSEPQSIRG